MLSQIVFAAYDYARQLNPFQSLPLSAPTRETFDILESLNVKFKNQDDVDVHLVAKAFKDIPINEDILQVSLSDTYNVLQRSVIWNKIDIVKLILERKCFSSNELDTNCPLHLACYLGYKDIVLLLLKHGADPSQRSSLTFHTPSGPEKLIPDIFKGNFPMQRGPKEVAYHFAICGDHVEILQVLLAAGSKNVLSLVTDGNESALLFVACKAGSKKCLSFLLEEKSSTEIVNAVDEEGATPLHYAVVHGIWFVEKLLYHGANIRACDRLGQNILHKLFAVDGRLNSEFYLVTQFLLNAGFHRDINSIDRHGYTPLLLILHHLNSCWQTAENDTLDDFNASLVSSINLMLSYGANPNIQCSTGHSALHVLLHRSLFPYSKFSLTQSVRTDVSGIKLIKDILISLIEKGSADVNLPIKDGLTTPLLTWIFALQTCNISPEELMILQGPYLECLNFLLLHGANPNARPAFVLSPLASMISWCQIWLNRGHSTSLLDTIDVVEAIITKLFHNNAKILSVVKVDNKITFYSTYEALLSMCFNITQSSHFQVIYKLASCLMKWGLQSELYLPPNYFDDSGDSIKRHALFQFLQIGLRHPEFIDDIYFEQCLQLFCHFIDETTRRNCYLSTLEIISKSLSESAEEIQQKKLYHIYSKLYEDLSTVQSLKNLSRKTIIHSLNGKMPVKVSSLDLPNSLKDFILNLN